MGKISTIKEFMRFKRFPYYFKYTFFFSINKPSEGKIIRDCNGKWYIQEG